MRCANRVLGEECGAGWPDRWRDGDAGRGEARRSRANEGQVRNAKLNSEEGGLLRMDDADERGDQIRA